MQLINNNLKRIATILSVSVSCFLVFIKLIASVKTDSLAIFSTLIDSITDFLASLISFIAIHFSNKPATKSHKFGYGKSEALSAFLQAIFIASSGIWVIIDGFKRLINPIGITQINFGIHIMIFSIVLTLILVSFQTYVARKTNSLAIKADRAHYVVDILTNSAVVLSLALVYFFNFIYFDVIAAIFISVYLLVNAYCLAKESIDQLTDKELPLEIKNNIENIVLRTEGVQGFHDFRSRTLGDIYYFELHLEIDGALSLYKAHRISNEVETNILKIYPDSQIVIHQDPYGIHEKRLDHIIDGVCDL